LDVQRTSANAVINVQTNSSGNAIFQLINNGNATSSITQDRSANNLIILNGSSGSMVFNNNTAERMRIDTSGNVLIGTTTNTGKLVAALGGGHVFNTELNGTTLGSSNGVLVSNYLNQTTRLAAINFAADSSTAGSLIFGTATSSTLTERMRIDSSGNVGIGTSSPGAKFNVAGTSGTPQLLAGTSANAISLNVFDSGSIYLTSSVTNSTNFTIGTASSIPFIFFTNNTEKMRITSAGVVGIGTSSPNSTSKLHIAGGGTGTFGALRFSDEGLGNYWDIGRDNNVAGDFTIALNGTLRAAIDTSSNFKFNSGYGSAATAYGCRAWINFNGTTNSTRGSGGVTSVTKNGTGDYTINFNFTMPDTNYAVMGTALKNNGDYDGKFVQYSDSANTTTTTRVACDNASTGGIDRTDCNVIAVAVFR
jgi:hypothetical protein